MNEKTLNLNNTHFKFRLVTCLLIRRFSISLLFFRFAIRLKNRCRSRNRLKCRFLYRRRCSRQCRRSMKLFAFLKTSAFIVILQIIYIREIVKLLMKI